MKTIILVVMLFTYDGEGKVSEKSIEGFVQDSMADCVIEQKATMKTYYDHKDTAQRTGIMTMCSIREVSSDGYSTEGSKLTF